MHIQVQPKMQFGNLRAFPVNDLSYELAKTFNCKSFTLDQLKKLYHMGYEIEEVHPPMITHLLDK